MKKRFSPYERGKRWGYAIFKSNLELFGKRGLGKSDATAMTCGRYARDKSIKKTKSGKILDVHIYLRMSLYRRVRRIFTYNTLEIQGVI